MPMRFRNLSPAEQLTLPLYPVVFGLLGLTLFLQSPARSSSPALSTARLALHELPWLAPIQWWGLAFLTVAVVEATALLTPRPRIYIRALGAGAGLVGFWIVMIAWSAASSPLVSWTGPAWLLIPLIGQVASARQLASKQEQW